MGKKVAEIIVEVLEQAGVKRCYGIVGDTLNLIAEHLDKSSIEWVHVRHEEAGAFAAGTEALLTDRGSFQPFAAKSRSVPCPVPPA